MSIGNRVQETDTIGVTRTSIRLVPTFSALMKILFIAMWIADANEPGGRKLDNNLSLQDNCITNLSALYVPMTIWSRFLRPVS